MSQTQSDKQPILSDEESDQSTFNPQDKKSTKQSKSKQKSKKTNQSLQKQVKDEPQGKQKKKGGKKKQKQQKPQKSKKQAPPKRKPKSKKQGGGKDTQENKIKVLEYMQKQNRPYNLLNVFDNLHGKIKKPELEIILNELAQQGEFSCKQFGKNKVYFLNQDKFDFNMKEVEQVSHKYTLLKEQQKQLKDQNKRLNDQYRKIMSKKTVEELELDTLDLIGQISKLKKKKEYLVGEDIQKVDEEEVIAVEKQSDKLERQLKKRKRILKECLDAWSQMTQKKVPDVAEMIGIQLI